jgi:feruloyl esterase
MFIMSLILALGADVANASIGTPIPCGDLGRVDFSGIVDAPTSVQSAAVFAMDGRREYCKVTGSITPNLQVELRLPAHGWNGKFLAVANVMDGNRCDRYVKRGYACMPMFRHFKQRPNDLEWTAAMLTDVKARLDFNQGPHLLTLAGKAIATRYYSQAPRYSYFMGCSSGGNSAMVEAQTFPYDYNGIVVGAPNLSTPDWLMRTAWSARSSLDHEGRPILTRTDLELLHRSVLAECDLDDGAKDGVIGNPLHCHFKPSSLLCADVKQAGCLTKTQIEAVEKIYAGPPGMAAPSMLPGSELGWHVEIAHKVLRDFVPYFESIFYGAKPTMTPANFDFAADHSRIGLATVPTPNNPDLRKFKAAGGKLLGYLGANDNAHVLDLIDYYETVERTMGGRSATQDFFRFFLIPGMNHCGMEDHAVDYLSYLEAWVERNEPPDSIMAAHVRTAAKHVEFPLDPKSVRSTRPAFPYPIYAKYKGSGDINDGRNFGPVAMPSCTERTSH